MPAPHLLLASCRPCPPSNLFPLPRRALLLDESSHSRQDPELSQALAFVASECAQSFFTMMCRGDSTWTWESLAEFGHPT